MHDIVCQFLLFVKALTHIDMPFLILKMNFYQKARLSLMKKIIMIELKRNSKKWKVRDIERAEIKGKNKIHYQQYCKYL